MLEGEFGAELAEVRRICLFVDHAMAGRAEDKKVIGNRVTAAFAFGENRGTVAWLWNWSVAEVRGS